MRHNTCMVDTPKQFEMRLINMSRSAISDDFGSDADFVGLGGFGGLGGFCGFCGFGALDVTVGDSTGENGGGTGGGPADSTGENGGGTDGCPAPALLLLLLFLSLLDLFVLHI